MTRREPRDTQLACPGCGYTTPLTTAGLAAYGLRIHSCARHQAIAERRARGAAQRAAMDTTRRDCQHPGHPHEHGTYAAYGLDRCRCTPCRTTHATYARTRHRQIGYGTWRKLVDAEPVRQHVRALSAQSIGWKRVADAAGVSHGAMTKLLYGLEGRQPSRKVRVETAKKILAVTAEQAGRGAGALVPARPTWRRIEGLVALGYPKSWIAKQIGQRRALQLRRDYVLARTEQAVAELHDRIGDTPGPSQRARDYAAARGWLVPAYGTDEEIAEQARLSTVINREERQQRRELVARLTAQGLSAREIARRLDIDHRQVTRDRSLMRQAS